MTPVLVGVFRGRNDEKRGFNVPQADFPVCVRVYEGPEIDH